MIGRLLDGAEDVHAAVRELQQISFGGSPIAPTLFRRAVETFGPILTQVYGSSEVPHPVTVLRLEGDWEPDADRLLRSAGRAAVGADVRVLDERGAEVGAGEVGELMVAGPQLMEGYWDDPKATEEVLSDDGWYRSGDLVRLDADGLVTFEDRARDLIITGGLNVYPSEVERVLMEHPAVREVAVLGYPDDEWGESIIAYVVPSAPEPPEPDVLIDWVRERLAGYKKPRRIEYLDKLPLGSSNKVLKKELRAQLWQGRERRVG
jgi:acyl-CoA synthetase (AMP-forming)/AMP-acid ligase II